MADPSSSTSQTSFSNQASGSRAYRVSRTTHYLPPHSSPARVSEQDARLAAYKLIAFHSQRKGFSSATQSSLHEVHHLLKLYVSSLFSSANHAAELGQRSKISARDLVYSLETHGTSVDELSEFLREQTLEESASNESKGYSAKALGKLRQTFSAPVPVQPLDSSSKKWLDPTSSFLPSDSDTDSDTGYWSHSSASENELIYSRKAEYQKFVKRKEKRSRREERRKKVEAKIREKGSAAEAIAVDDAVWRRVAEGIIPSHLPGKPPRHTWLQTPSFPTNAYAVDDAALRGKSSTTAPIALVNRKLANARLVESSLRKLIQATDGAAARAYAASILSREKKGVEKGKVETESDTQGGATGSNKISPNSGPPSQPSAQTPPSEAAPSNADPSHADNVAPPASPSTKKDATGDQHLQQEPPSTPFTETNPARTRTRTGLTLRLKSSSNLNGGLNSPAIFSSPAPLTAGMTLPSRSRRNTQNSVPPSGIIFGAAGKEEGGIERGGLNSPMTPGYGSSGGPVTPYPPTPLGLGGQFFGSQQQSSIGIGGEDLRDEIQLGARMPGTVNYKNVWYDPSVKASAKNAKRKGLNETGGGAKRLRRWKV
ncbi:hypothetical protein IE53DRAFT_390867 [Violaceomyces palustris]|uniref:Uncharacterized protein n=1 Tax=Violaceomyces palustris TaxID=1673888 RepID=A0ACD0NMK9_9BASI|nr:hypothetical protein IE53DRAFT_390867 [Violaceomyces palustris]